VNGQTFPMQARHPYPSPLVMSWRGRDSAGRITLRPPFDMPDRSSKKRFRGERIPHSRWSCHGSGHLHVFRLGEEDMLTGPYFEAAP